MSYDVMAIEYDKRYYDIDNLDNKKIEIELSNHLTKLEPKKILEIGCGTGHWIQFVSNVVKNIECLIGIDLSFEMITRAREKLAANTSVQLIHDDFRKYTHRHKYDFIMTNFFWSTVGDEVNFYKQSCYINELMTNKGVFFIIENKMPDQMINGVDKSTTICLNEKWDDQVIKMEYKLYDPSYLCTQLKKAGFELVNQFDISSDIYGIVVQKNER